MNAQAERSKTIRKPELINKRTRAKFCDYFSGCVLREIDAFFESEGFAPAQLLQEVGGQRRTRVAEYYAGIDWTSHVEVGRVLRIFEEVLRKVEPGHPFQKELLELLDRDGYVLRDGRLVPRSPEQGLKSLMATLPALSEGDFPTLLQRIQEAVERDPGLAVGSAKELAETVCKTILRDSGIEVDRSTDLPALVKQVCKHLSLVPEAIPDGAKGADIIRRTLSNLASVATGLAELRNLYGSGHGRASASGGLEPRHSRLAVSAACALVTFLVETHGKRKAREVAA